jgi:hypothetical protein
MPHAHATWYRLAAAGDEQGVSCSDQGVSVGPVPLLTRVATPGGGFRWRPRPAAEISAALSDCYGFAFDATAKMRGLEAVAHALTRGDTVLAQIVTLNLHLSDPPRIEKRDPLTEHPGRPYQSDISKTGWDASLHPRWPAGDPSGRGGRFQPADGSSAENLPEPVPAQATFIDPLPLPWELPWVAPIPRPTEILPPPLYVPDGQERTRPPLVNPFPGKRRCVEEWEHAFEYCDEQRKKGNFRPGRGGPGKDYHSCVMGQVSQSCGGNATEA